MNSYQSWKYTRNSLPGILAAYAVALTPAAIRRPDRSPSKNLPPIVWPANLSPYAAGSMTYSDRKLAMGV